MRMFVTFLLLMEPASRKPNPAFIIMYQTTKNMQHISIHFLCPFRRSLQNIYTCHVFSYQYMNGLNRYLIQNGTCIKITRDPFTRRNSWFKLTFSVSTSVKIGLYKNKEYGKSYWWCYWKPKTNLLKSTRWITVTRLQRHCFFLGNEAAKKKPFPSRFSMLRNLRK